MSLFADDIALYRHIKSSVDYWKLQLDITALVDWISRHYLSLQPSKCCYMLITRKRTCSIPPPILYVSEIPLQLVSSVRYLGVQLNSDLSWSPHITNLCTKARQLVGLLYRRFYKHANTSTLLQLYKSFIRPHLEYCAIVWDPHLYMYISRNYYRLKKKKKKKACISLAVFKSPDVRAAIAQLPECAAAFCRKSVNMKPTQS